MGSLAIIIRGLFVGQEGVQLFLIGFDGIIDAGLFQGLHKFVGGSVHIRHHTGVQHGQLFGHHSGDRAGFRAETIIVEGIAQAQGNSSGIFKGLQILVILFRQRSGHLAVHLGAVADEGSIVPLSKTMVDQYILSIPGTMKNMTGQQDIKTRLLRTR